MLVQTKLFSPPPTTPEAEMQQKTMKYMMIFMAVMFYKVPSGLGIYFITSSLWSIGERLLLPKITHAAPPKPGARTDPARGGSRGKGGPKATARPLPRSPPAAFAQFWEKILDEARKDPTYRKMVEERDGKDRNGPARRPRTGASRGRGREEMTATSPGKPPRFAVSARDEESKWSPAIVLSPRLIPRTRSRRWPARRGRGCGGWSGSRGRRRGRIALDGIRAPTPRGPPPRRAEVRRGSLRVDGLRPRLPALARPLAGAENLYGAGRRRDPHRRARLPLVNLVLANCLARGARHAQPGEFTLRAFLSGRIDLTRAEAVLGVIDARNPASSTRRSEQLAGGLSGPILALRDRLLDLLAHLEANLDFVEEPDVDPLGRAAAGRGARVVRGRARPLWPGGSRGETGRRAPRVVLTGPPNAGKSRLFNALVGDDHAIVSPQAGTTRDYLTALCECGGMIVELVDTAGIEDPPRPHRDPGPVAPDRPGRAGRPDPGLPFRRRDRGDPQSLRRPRPFAPGLDQVRRLPAGTG